MVPILEQANAVYQQPINNLYSPTHNLGWKNHLNLSWSQGQYQGAPNSSMQSSATVSSLDQMQVSIYSQTPRIKGTSIIDYMHIINHI